MIKVERDTMMWALYERVNAAFAEGDVDLALVGAGELIRLFPREPIGYSASARFHVQNNKLEAAEAIAIEGLQKAGHNRWILHWLAETAMKSGDLEKAEARWRRLTELFPDHREGYLRYIDCLIAQNKNSAISPLATNYLMTIGSVGEVDEKLLIKLLNALTASADILASCIIWMSINPKTASDSYLTATWNLLIRTCEPSSSEDLKRSRVRLLSVLACEQPGINPEWMPKLHQEIYKLFHSNKTTFDAIVRAISECHLSDAGSSRQIQALLGLCECEFKKEAPSQSLARLISFIQTDSSHLISSLNEMFPGAIPGKLAEAPPM